MSDDRRDAFLRELEPGDLEALASSLPARALDPSVRARLLDAAQPSGRLWHFAERVAELLDLSVQRARELLDSLDDPAVWEHEGPGVALYWVEGGPRVQDAVRGFVRIDAGLSFPHHEHLGEERVLILQGAYRDTISDQRFRSGDLVRMARDTSHAVIVPSDGVDLLKLVVVFGGVRTAAKLYEPR